jgi:formylmethanofuran dehydrogenase subunit E
VKFKLISFILGFIKKNKQEESINNIEVKEEIKEEVIILKPNEIICEDCGEVATSYATDANYKKICLTCYNKTYAKTI